MLSLTYKTVRELISYDPATGVCRWNYRDVKWFKSERSRKSWNSKQGGKIVGNKSTKGYLQISIFYKNYQLHRIIWLYMTGEWPNQVDHINGIRHDNRWENLRNVSNQENQRNKKLSIKNTSGRCGVSFDKQTMKWRSYIGVDNKKKFLGYFSCKEEAIRVRKSAENEFNFHENDGRR